MAFVFGIVVLPMGTEKITSSLPNELFAEPLSQSSITGLPDMERFPQTFGYPEISGGTSDVREYYARYLKAKYPDWADEVLQANLDRALSIPEVRANIESMFELEKKIRQDNPNWTGGWMGDAPPKKE